jgi:dTDP-4-dehydrorhamnose reductase
VSTWLVTGAGGQLGHHLAQVLTERADPHGDTVVALDRTGFDITDPAAVDAVLARHRPDVVINAAAYTAVDAAETDEARADLVNHVAPRLLAEGLARHGGRLIQVSTDYVFAGDAQRPYEPDDPTGPRTAYGRTKLAGEQAALAALPERTTVVRTAWVYGGPSANFVDTMLRLERERDTLDVVADQIGSPTFVHDLAYGLVALGTATEPGPGVLHFANAGQASWFDLARETFRLAGADPERVHPVDSAAFPRPAPRPAWSVLSSEAWVAARLPAPRGWQDALADHLGGGNDDRLTDRAVTSTHSVTAPKET